ncbi:MAG: MBL fold metallo-hydrolase RNA specificity domain-containing protein, partial [Bellilinea sp.]
MIIHFNGASQTVTGSQFLLEVNGHKLLLECGLYQGHRKDYYQRNRTFSFNPAKLDAVLLSHAHIDHSGNLPNLVKNGLDCPIYTTRATAHLADVMLRDSGHIQEADVEFLNRKRARRGEPPVEPLYTVADAERVNDYFKPVQYNQTIEPVPGVQATFVDAGHILGSAAIVLDINENGRKFRFWFSGDIGRDRLPLLQDPVMPKDADYMMMECTYGDKPHEDPEEAYIELRDSVRRAVDRRGKIIIPAFAVGRTQELVYYFNRMISAGEVPAIPVFVDSPLAVETSKVFMKFADLFDDETKEFVRSNRHPALNYPQLTYIESVDQSKALNDRHDPMIIISASGMAETGRILHHLRNNIQNPKNMVLIVSWQAPHTLGRRLADREPMVRIFGEPYDRRAEVVTIGGLSAHAGQTKLLQYARASQNSLREVYLIHGEEDAAAIFMKLLAQQGFKNVHYPGWGQSLEI